MTDIAAAVGEARHWVHVLSRAIGIVIVMLTVWVVVTPFLEPMVSSHTFGSAFGAWLLFTTALVWLYGQYATA